MTKYQADLLRMLASQRIEFACKRCARRALEIPKFKNCPSCVAGGRDLLVVAPYVSLAPGIALVVTVLATTLLGDAWRDRLAGTRSVLQRAEEMP